jgi:hypothetical protein
MSVEKSNMNFKTVLQAEFDLTMVQVARSMFDKYFTEAFTSYQVHRVEDMIMTATLGVRDEKLYECRVACWKKTTWMSKMKVIRSAIVDTVRKRKCDCNKLWYECRNTCIKPKTNPRPIEFPQDVFNIIKDYMDIVDVPTPMWNDMMKASIKDICANQSYGGKSLVYFKPYPPSVYHRKIPLALRKRRYWVGRIRAAKNDVAPVLRYIQTQNDIEFEKWLGGRTFIKSFYPKFCEEIRFEATHYTWCVLDKLWQHMDGKVGNRILSIDNICKSMGQPERNELFLSLSKSFP